MIVALAIVITSCLFFLLPIPLLLIDLALIAILIVSFSILATTLTSQSDKDFYGFPNLLILVTIARLALNAACARKILAANHNTLYPAGKVINIFSQIIAGNNIAIGIVIFLLIMIVNFIVIVRGSSRIAEVHARFALDSLPGKQVAIDAELNSGAISNEEASAKRARLQQEINFYGSMDGAAKFAHGEVIASMLITLVNIIAGIIIGIMQNNMTIYDAVVIYTSMSIGEGLITQICSLLLAASLGMIVSGARNQFIFNNNIFRILSYILGTCAFLPGMPHISFFTSAIILYFLAQERIAENKPENLQILISKNLLDSFGLSECQSAIKKIILNFEKNQGITFQDFGIKEDLDSQNMLSIVFSEITLDSCEVYFDKFLSFEQDAEATYSSLFKKMYWNAKQNEQTIEPFVVLCMSTKHMLQNNLHEIFQLQDLSLKLKNLQPEYQRLMKNILQHLKITDIKNILVQLIRERISIGRFEIIVEALDASCSTRQLDAILNHVRVRLSRYICEQYINKKDKKLHIYQLGIQWITFCKKCVNSNLLSIGQDNEKILLEAIDNLSFLGPVVLVVPIDIRKIVSNLLLASGRFFPILSYGEIPQGFDKIKDLGELSLPMPVENNIL